MRPLRSLAPCSWACAALAGALAVTSWGIGEQAGALPPPSAAAHTGTGSWPYPDHDLSNSRLATQSSIKASNVARLSEFWQTTTSPGIPIAGALATSPIIVGDSVFVENVFGVVFRINLRTGAILWKSSGRGVSVGPYGVAVAWGKVFAATPTGVVALDKTNGSQLWATTLTQNAVEGVDVQPQVIGHDVIASTVPVDVSTFYGGGARGRVDALDEKTGRLLWSFDTVDSSNLWGNPAVNSGGGSWYPPSYSPSSGLLYVGIANPGPFVGTPQYPNGTSRPGANLYTDSTVALRLTNGRLVWYHQATPHDLRDYDFVHTMVVPVPASNGKPATTVVVGTGKSGLVIGMNPLNGRQLWRTPVGEHLNDTLPALSGPTETLPGTFGGVLTPPASAHGTVFVATLNAPDTLYPDKTAYFGGKIGTMPGEVVAINARTGKHLWDTKVPGDPTGGVTLVNNLVFTATYQGKILALSASNGRIVWQMHAPGGINGWMSIVGDTIVVPVGLANPAILLALHLDPRW
jgi:outer membrane protein assembly factor BamB